MTGVQKLTIAEVHKKFEAQGVSSHKHYATKCPACHTVQSMYSMVQAGANKGDVPTLFGFSCEGRLTGAGPASKAKENGVRGCDWSLGGLFQIHEYEVIHEDGESHPMFKIATPEEAQALEQQYTPPAQGDA